MYISALNSRLDGVKYYDTLIRTDYGVSIATDIFNQCIKDAFWPWRSDEYIIKECCRSYAKKMKISVQEFILIDGGGLSAILTTSAVSAVKQLFGNLSQALGDEVTIYRLYERDDSLDIVWKGHVKNYGMRGNELLTLLERKGIISPVDEMGMIARENQYKNAIRY